MEQNHVYGQAHLAHPLKAIMPIGIGIGLKIVAANGHSGNAVRNTRVFNKRKNQK